MLITDNCKIIAKKLVAITITQNDTHHIKNIESL